MTRQTTTRSWFPMLAAAAAALGLVLGAGACGPGSTSGTSGSGDSNAQDSQNSHDAQDSNVDNADGAGTESGANLDACELLTKERILDATSDLATTIEVGEQMAETAPTPDPVLGQISKCGYELSGSSTDGGSSTDAQGGNLALKVSEKGANIEFHPSDSAKQVSGVGDGAYWSAPGELRVKVGDASLTVLARIPSAGDLAEKQAVDEDIATELAKVVAGEL